MDKQDCGKAAREHGIIERGTVTEITAGKYTVASIDREGIVTPPLPPLMEENSFSVGDQVIYFYFNDGTGRIICVL